METTKKYYLYVFLNNLKPGNYYYEKYNFEYEPYYIGVSNTDTYYVREEVHIKYAKLKQDVCNNKLKMNIINKIIKNGLEPIYLKIEENLSKEEAFEMEKMIIKIIGTKIGKSGPLSNISLGGDGGDTFTNNPNKEEIREKHRQNALGIKNNMYGLPLEKRPSHIAKINGVHWNKGRMISKETKEKFSILRKGDKNNTAKKTLLFDSNFNFINEFSCALYVAEFINANNKSVSKTARENSKKDIPYHTSKGYYIIYKNDWDNKFKEKENEIKEFLKTFKKNKNQFS